MGDAWYGEMRERTWSMNDGMEWRVLLDEAGAMRLAVQCVLTNAQSVPNSETVIVNARLMDALEQALEQPLHYLDAERQRRAAPSQPEETPQ